MAKQKPVVANKPVAKKVTKERLSAVADSIGSKGAYNQMNSQVFRKLAKKTPSLAKDYNGVADSLSKRSKAELNTFSRYKKLAGASFSPALNKTIFDKKKK